MKKRFYAIVAKYGLGKPEMAELLEARYGSVSAFLKTGINRVCYLMKNDRIFALTSVTLELSAFCNLKCSICPVNRGMKREKGYMDFDLVKKIADENPKLSFFLLYHWGESLLHPELYKIIEYIKMKRIKTFLTTNGTLLDEKNIRGLISSGLDRLTISMDGIGEYYEKIRGVPYKDLEANIVELIRQRDRAKSGLKIDIDMTITKENEENVDDFKMKWQGIADMVRIHPYVFVGGASERQIHPPCNEVWRGNLIVLWDGRVVPCCVDYEGELILGDANKESLKEIINGGPMRTLRRSLTNGRLMPLCSRCGELNTQKVNPRFF
ncbi:MAG TPA: radical SAM/SPASM domain-containing protein [Candidatus Omnitrophota bacterium]|nr:radical SAM/SPASM domain-containing protein [Candidatus Omnitrophota bacterium]HPS20097.1 radical SAM/SPASM domain-containing protein [Candidatus Omnitrophota bacterium]